jgi:hypothetical protein
MDDGPELSLADNMPVGLVIGTLVGLGRDGQPLVRFATIGGDKVVLGRATAALDQSDIGAEVVLVLDQADPCRPIVLGRLSRPAAPTEASEELAVTVDGDRLELSAEREIVLRCGRASITLTRTGKIVLRGTYVLSRSSGPNKIRGGSIQLN